MRKLRSPMLTKPGSAFYLLVSTTCVACSVASCSVTENPSAGRSRPVSSAPPLTEGNRCECKVEGIDQPSLQILPHGGNTASDLDILVTRCLFREPQRLFDSAADKVEGRPAFHQKGLTLVVRQNEGRRMIWRIGTPPSLP